MKRRTVFLLIALITFSIGVALTLFLLPHRSSSSPRTPEKVEVERPVQNESNEATTFDRGIVDYKGISFNYDASLASGMKAETVGATPLEYESDVPASVYPEHVAFTLLDVRVAPRESDEPSIRVCPIAEYLKAFSVSSRDTAEAGKTMRALRLLLQRQPRVLPREVPLLPFPDAEQAFHSRAHYLKFKNGKGVVYLTEWQQEESLIDNQGLFYEFQGFTDDGRYYVSAELSVNAPFLGDKSDPSTQDSLKVPNCYECREWAAFKRRYRAYVLGVSARLEKLQPNEFQPSLRLYDEMLSSLEIK